jgi:5-methylcytosine-specific restriction endonuclease McrA
MKTCIKCKENKVFDAFYKKKGTRDGFFQWCIACHKLVTSARHADRRKTDPVFVVKEAKKVSVWRKENPEKYQNTVQSYIKRNLPKLVAKAKFYRNRKASRTPKWLSDSDLWMIEEAYELASLRTKITGFKWHVDHVLPLQGKLVSGLHTPYNLQVIPGRINQSKGNAFTPT